jgi:phage gpG-like protein
LVKDVILNKPEQIFEDFRLRGELVEGRRAITRKLAHFLRKENFQFFLEDKVCFEEKLEERHARTGLSQLLESTELEETEINEESCLEAA